MRQAVTALALTLALLGAGCLGAAPGDDATPAATDGATHEDASHTHTGDGHAAMDAAGNATGAAPFRIDWNGTAAFGVPMHAQTGQKDDFIKMSLENGLNGTYVLGYAIDVPAGHDALTVRAEAPAVDPLGQTPDYDLYLFDPNGEVADSSYEFGTNEKVYVNDPAEGTWLAGLLFFAGAQGSVHVIAEGK